MSRVRYSAITGFVVLVLALAGCGPQTEEVSTSAGAPDAAAIGSNGFSKGACHRMGGIGIQDWNNPIAGDEVALMALAAPQLEFQPRMPNGLGSPAKMLVTPPASESSGTPRGLTLIFDKDPYGRVLFQESLWQGPADFGKFAQDTASGNIGTGVAVGGDKLPCGPTSEATTLKSGLPALLLHQPDGSRYSVMWLEGKVRYDVLAPGLTREQVLEIANGAWN